MKEINILELSNGMRIYEGEDETIIKVPKRKKFYCKGLRRWLIYKIIEIDHKLYGGYILFYKWGYRQSVLDLMKQYLRLKIKYTKERG